MTSLDDLITLGVLAAIILGIAAFYGFLIRRQFRLFWAAMIRLRDKIDRSDDSLR